MRESTREVWKNLSPETRQTFEDLAFKNEGGQLSSVIEEVIKDNAIQDVVEQEQGEQ